MSAHNIGLTLDANNLLNDLYNLALLRSDIHLALGERKFVFCPKGQTFVAHMLEPSPDLVQLYHNVPVQLPFSCHPYFLFARLAWAIFPCLAGFWSKPGVKRAVLMCKETEDGRELVEQEVTVTPEFQAKITSSRSRSPKKRSRIQDDPAETLGQDNKRSRSQETLERTESSMALKASQRHAIGDKNSDNQAAFPTSDAGDQSLPRARSHDRQRVRREMSQQALQLCPSWYEGHKRIDAMRESWLAKERQLNQDTVALSHPNPEHPRTPRFKRRQRERFVKMT